jgi:hypothetical protein
MHDCALIDENTMMVTCSSKEWDGIIPQEFPDNLKYLRVQGQNWQNLMETIK